MASTITADRRRAHLRVGAAATASFVILLLFLAIHGSAASDRITPAGAPTTQPQQVGPSDPDPGFRHRHDGFGRRGPDGGGGGDDGGAAPVPNSSGNTT
jgi:hypothetical protein